MGGKRHRSRNRGPPSGKKHPKAGHPDDLGAKKLNELLKGAKATWAARAEARADALAKRPPKPAKGARRPKSQEREGEAPQPAAKAAGKQAKTEAPPEFAHPNKLRARLTEKLDRMRKRRNTLMKSEKPCARVKNSARTGQLKPLRQRISKAKKQLKDVQHYMKTKKASAPSPDPLHLAPAGPQNAANALPTTSAAGGNNRHPERIISKTDTPGSVKHGFLFQLQPSISPRSAAPQCNSRHALCTPLPPAPAFSHPLITQPTKTPTCPQWVLPQVSGRPGGAAEADPGSVGRVSIHTSRIHPSPRVLTPC